MDTSWFKLLTKYQQETLGLLNDATIEEDSNFLLSGGDSLKALHLCEDILAATGGASPDLLEVILDGSFSDVLRHIERMTVMPPTENKMSEAKKRSAEASSATPAKRGLTEQKEKRSFKVLRRAGEVMEVRNSETDVSSKEDFLKGEVSCVKNGALELSLSWSSDTGRCVDASPVLLVTDATKRTVFIGSHSHRIQALALNTGSLVWERVLGDRMEASAAVTRCGSLVVIGQ